MHGWTGPVAVIERVLASVASHGHFTPNHPYFQQGTANGTLTGYHDHGQLINQMPVNSVNAGYDVNIAAAWTRGLTGNGLISSFVESGTQGLHPDLSEGL